MTSYEEFVLPRCLKFDVLDVPTALQEFTVSQMADTILFLGDKQYALFDRNRDGLYLHSGQVNSTSV